MRRTSTKLVLSLNPTTTSYRNIARRKTLELQDTQPSKFPSSTKVVAKRNTKLGAESVWVGRWEEKAGL